MARHHFDRCAWRPKRRESRAKRLRRLSLYCLEPVPGEPGVLACLNRRYKPTGEGNGHDAPGGPTNAEHFNRVPANLLDLRVCRQVEDRFYLFDDRTAPWYSKRLEREYEERLGALWKVAPLSAAELTAHAYDRFPLRRVGS